MSLPSEEVQQAVPVELEVSLRLYGETVLCRGYIPEEEWTSLKDTDAQFQELKVSLASAMDSVLGLVESSEMLKDPQSCPDPVQSPE